MITEKGKRILLAESDRDLLAAIYGVLTDGGYSVTSAHDGVIAVNDIENGTFELLVVGDDVSRLRYETVAEKFFSDFAAPTVILKKNDEKIAEENGRDRKKTFYLELPFSAKKLKEVVALALGDVVEDHSVLQEQ